MTTQSGRASQKRFPRSTYRLALVLTVGFLVLLGSVPVEAQKWKKIKEKTSKVLRKAAEKIDGKSDAVEETVEEAKETADETLDTANELQPPEPVEPTVEPLAAVPPGVVEAYMQFTPSQKIVFGFCRVREDLLETDCDCLVDAVPEVVRGLREEGLVGATEEPAFHPLWNGLRSHIDGQCKDSERAAWIERLSPTEAEVLEACRKPTTIWDCECLTEAVPEALRIISTEWRASLLARFESACESGSLRHARVYERDYGTSDPCELLRIVQETAPGELPGDGEADVNQIVRRLQDENIESGCRDPMRIVHRYPCDPTGSLDPAIDRNAYCHCYHNEMLAAFLRPQAPSPSSTVEVELSSRAMTKCRQRLGAP